MKNSSPAAAKGTQAEIAGLVKRLYDTHQRLSNLTGGQIDAVLHPTGQFYMLPEAQRQVREYAERFRGSFAGAATGIALVVPHGSYLHANAAYCRMLGYTEYELRAITFGSLAHPDDVVVCSKLTDELLAGERDNFFVELRYVKKGGAVVWARHSVSATHARGGNVTTLMVIAEDIAERKTADDALRHSEERLRLITDLVPHGIFAKDADGRHFFANPALAELAGLSIEEILGKSDFDLVADKAQAEAFRADDCAVMQSGRKMVIAEEPRTDLSGRTRFLQTIKIPFTVGDTGEPAILGVCSDITEQKRTEARFRRLVDSNVQGVYFWNTNGRVTGANDAFLRMIGYARDDLDAGRVSWSEMTPPELVEQDRRVLKELATAGVCEPFEKEFIRRDGSRVPVFIGPATFEDCPDEGLCFVLDLSERKKLEQQFLRAQRMESIGALAGGVAHDLNNILLPIILSIGILRSEFSSARTRVILETISDSAKRGADIVRQVLWFARGMEGQRIEVQLAHLLKDLENIVRETFPKNIRLRVSVPDDIWALLGDPTQVHQILLNLCVNARDAMPNGGRLSISAENRVLDRNKVTVEGAPAQPGRYVYINVTDTGTGIPQSAIHKIFEPFFTTKELNKGTGLGLSTVMAIVKSHKGTVDVYSEPGKGTTFEVYLPALGDILEPQRERPLKATLPRGNGETILVVDDEPSILTVTAETLETFGYRVLTARDGMEALASYAENKNEIAVVLTDTVMPAMDGSSLIGVLLRMDPAIKIVRTSGLDSKVAGATLPAAGDKRFLAKPYTAEDLLETIRAILKQTDT